MKNGVEYYMNALYYNVWCCWRSSFAMGIKMMRLLYPGKNNAKGYNDSLKDLDNYKDGLFIGFFFERLYIVGVWGSFILPFGLISFSLLYDITASESISSFVSIACLIIGYFPLYRYVLWHDRYVKYFKIFRRKSKAWHKKWRIIAIVFVIVSWLMFVGGVIGMVYVGELLM